MEEEVIEECWPSMGNGNLNGFAKHELLRIILRRPKNPTNKEPSSSLELECVSSLSPLDMINLSYGTHDSTGHSVWTGALFLLEFLAANDRNDEEHYLSRCFRSKRVLELGCGSGVSGLALLLSPNEWKSRPSHVTFTDNDEEVLALCRRNCQRNLPSNQYDNDYSIIPLSWGKQVEVDGTSSHNRNHKLPPSRQQNNSHQLFETVIATDVIYDLGCLQALLWTASNSLEDFGQFVLSHVPRACLPNYEHRDDNDYHHQLEQNIVKTAERNSLKLVMMIRPHDVIQEGHGVCNSPLNNKSLSEMEESGAALMIFQKIEEFCTCY